ncbi:MAG: ATPase domain-containing protein [Nitrososphaerota archaeon]|nr:ATPase domain-containing protein [Nitrososphaerota archaeon]
MLQKIPTGCKGLDEILEGGLTAGSISLIYGEAETAKTTLAMQCAVNCARKGFKALFVDCDGTFSARRLSQMASVDFEKIAELIILARPRDFREQTTLIDQLPNYVAKGFGLVVFDTITHLYRLAVAEKPEKTFEINRELNRQMAWLAQFAKTRKIVVLVASQVRSVFEDVYVSVEPVATRVLRFWADVIIAMKPTENAKIVMATVEKRPETGQPISFHLKIDESGLSEYPVP